MTDQILDMSSNPAETDELSSKFDESSEAALESESLLVKQAREDPGAFGALYEAYVDRIYAYIFHRVSNVQEAEDLTARVFFRALSKLSTYEDRGLPFGAWLFRIAHNLVANWHRDHSRRRHVPLDVVILPAQNQNEPEPRVEIEEERAALWRAIEKLPIERQQLLLYKFGSRLSNIEIGDIMDRSEGAIKSLYFRTLATLRRELQRMNWTRETTSADRMEDGE